MATEQRTPDKTASAARTPSGKAVLTVAATSFLLELATVIALVLDNCTLGMILAVLAALFGGATVMMVRSGSGDKPDPWSYDPPPNR
jgi:hypothetical protein